VFLISPQILERLAKTACKIDKRSRKYFEFYLKYNNKISVTVVVVAIRTTTTTTTYRMVIRI